MHSILPLFATTLQGIFFVTFFMIEFLKLAILQLWQMKVMNYCEEVMLVL